MKNYLLLLLIFFCTHQSFAEGKLRYLHKYIGTYQSEEGPLFTDPTVKKAMAETFGDKLPHLLKNLEVRGPVNFISGNLVLSGNAPHLGGSDMAILVINTYRGSVHGAISSGEEIEVFSTVEKYRYLPLALKDWIVIVQSGLKHRSTKPAGVTWKR